MALCMLNSTRVMGYNSIDQYKEKGIINEKTALCEERGGRIYEAEFKEPEYTRPVYLYS